ncbi:MAG: hypothetical protein ACKVT0_23730 [Planctomycetaceae bacterium]
MKLLNRRAHRIPATLLAFAFVAMVSSVARGEGSENSTRGEDFEMTVDSRWTGGEFGGYLPIRVRIANHGVSRDLRVVINSKENQQNLNVERAVSVPQNSVVRMTLSVPLVTYNMYNSLKVYGPDGEIRALNQTLNFSTPTGVQQTSPALLAVSASPIDFTPWRQAMSRNLATSPASYGSYGGYYGGHSSYTSITDQEVVPAAALPDNWIDYTALDIVAIPLGDFEALTAEQRTALRQWVHTGGTLFLTKVDDWEKNQPTVERLLELDRVLNKSSEWELANLAARENFKQLTTINTLEESRSGRGGMTVTTEAVNTNVPPPQMVWVDATPIFRSRKVLLGDVYAFRDDPFPGSDADWTWFYTHRNRQRNWDTRNGFSSRSGHQEFMQFNIPGITQVPVTAFLILISAFAIVIGPINYLYFQRRKQLAMIVVSIPLIAVMTTITLFAYTVVSHGFDVKSRTRSITLLDQRSQQAISFSRNSLYTGFTPSNGLEFSPQTAVYPIWNAGQVFEKGSIDWSSSQHFTSGWFQSRTKTQFYTVNYRDERSRLTVHPPAGGKLVVENGFEWQFDALCVLGSDDQYYIGFDIPSGSKAELNLLDPESQQRFIEQRDRHAPAFVGNYTPSYTPDYRAMRYGYHPSMHNQSTGSFQQNAIHQLFLQNTSFMSAEARKNWSNSNPAYTNSSANYYVGITSQNPGADVGISDTDERDSTHFLIGYYE